METITKHIQVFTFAELSDAAKQKALQWNAENLEDFWSDGVIHDAKDVASLMGWNIDNIYWSGFWSQGEGACFVGTMGYRKDCAKEVKAYAPQDETLHAIARDWQALQRRNFYALSARVSHRGRYYHSLCTSFECSDSRKSYNWCADDAEEEIKRIGRQFMNWIYRQLNTEYEYRTSVECFAEDCEANEWRFLASGEFFWG